MACELSGMVYPRIMNENESVIKFVASITGTDHNFEFELFLPVASRKDIIQLRKVEDKIIKAELSKVDSKFNIISSKGYLLMMDMSSAKDLALNILSKKKGLFTRSKSYMLELTEALKNRKLVLVLKPNLKEKLDELKDTPITVTIE